jgi:hypothetical protein
MLALVLSPLDLLRLALASVLCAAFAFDSDCELARRVRDGKPRRTDGARRGFVTLELAASWAVILAAGLLALALDPKLLAFALLGAFASLALVALGRSASTGAGGNGAEPAQTTNRAAHSDARGVRLGGRGAAPEGDSNLPRVAAIR